MGTQVIKLSSRVKMRDWRRTRHWQRRLAISKRMWRLFFLFRTWEPTSGWTLLHLSIYIAATIGKNAFPVHGSQRITFRKKKGTPWPASKRPKKRDRGLCFLIDFETSSIFSADAFHCLSHFKYVKVTHLLRSTISGGLFQFFLIVSPENVSSSRAWPNGPCIKEPVSSDILSSPPRLADEKEIKRCVSSVGR